MFKFTPQTFIQNNLEQSTNIYKKICLTINHDKPKKILDLYCGFGITSLLLAKQGHFITGMEYNSEAIRFAKNNSQLNRLTHAKFLEGDVDQLLPKYFKSQRADTIIVNPPREGLSKNVVQILLKNLPEEIIYISCMPTTLARDLSFLCQNHYEIKECCIYDMFPQTSHVETFIYLRKR
jgi:23S rRNA (uracil1939-C5)-methyltransferase